MSSTDAAKNLTLRDCAAGSETLLALWHDFLSGRLSHATLFSGESGIGKKTFARLLAQGLLCSGNGDKPCGECRDCRRFLARTHPDALFPAPLAKEKTIRIDALREMIDALSRHSLEGGKRVILIENAERMTPQAQNCLLKTLEEADEGTYFLLTCDIESLGRALSMQEDSAYWQARETVKKTFLSIKSIRDIPGAAQRLKDQKDAGDRLLDILEQEIRALMHGKVLRQEDKSDDFPPAWENAPPQSLRVILEAVLAARRRKNANVGWAALSEGLMQAIAEEAKKWQA